MSLPLIQRKKRLSLLTAAEIEALAHDWTFWARPNQLAPDGSWRYWLILAGRGWGKTRTGAEWVRSLAESKKVSRIALIGQTAADVRDVMVEGDSGILKISNPRFRPEYIPSKRVLIWPNGCRAHTYSADEPDQLRGPQFDAGWCDELAKWSYRAAWDNFLFGLRLGTDPKACITTTPTPSPLIKELVKDNLTALTKGSTYENKNNLASQFIEAIVKRYEGTRLGRQELHAEILEDNPGALWRLSLLDELRVKTLPTFKRVVVGVDPAVTSGENSDETGIIVAGLSEDNTAFVLDDLSGRYSPSEWAKMVCFAYDKWSADLIVAETNQGGDLVYNNIMTENPTAAVKKVHAKKGKYLRAEPISSLYEKNRVKHYGMFSILESQMCDFVPGTKESPDRLDALVYCLTELMLKESIEWVFG